MIPHIIVQEQRCRTEKKIGFPVMWLAPDKYVVYLIELAFLRVFFVLAGLSTKLV